MLGFFLVTIMNLVNNIFLADAEKRDNHFQSENFWVKFKAACQNGVSYIGNSVHKVSTLSKLCNIVTKIIKFVQVIFGEDHFPVLIAIKIPIKAVKNITSTLKLADKTNHLLALNSQTSKLRIAHKVTSFVASILKTIKYFGSLGLIDLGKYATFIGKIPFLSFIKVLPLGIVVNMFQFVGSSLGAIENAVEFFSVERRIKISGKSLNKWNQRKQDMDEVLKYVREEAQLRKLKEKAIEKTIVKPNPAIELNPIQPPEPEAANLDAEPIAHLPKEEEKLNENRVIEAVEPEIQPLPLQQENFKGNNIFVGALREIQYAPSAQKAIDDFEKGIREKLFNPNALIGKEGKKVQNFNALENPERLGIDKSMEVKDPKQGMADSDLHKIYAQFLKPIDPFLPGFEEKIYPESPQVDNVLENDYKKLDLVEENKLPNITVNLKEPNPLVNLIAQGPPENPVPQVIQDPLVNPVPQDLEVKTEVGIDPQDDSILRPNAQNLPVKEEVVKNLQHDSTIQTDAAVELGETLIIPPETKIIASEEPRVEGKEMTLLEKANLRNFLTAKRSLRDHYRKRLLNANDIILRPENANKLQLDNLHAKIFKWQHILEILNGNDEKLLEEVNQQFDRKVDEKINQIDTLTQAKAQQVISFIYSVAKVILAVSSIFLFISGIGTVGVLAGFFVLTVLTYSFGMFKFFWKESHKLPKKTDRKLLIYPKMKIEKSKKKKVDKQKRNPPQAAVKQKYYTEPRRKRKKQRPIVNTL